MKKKEKMKEKGMKHEKKEMKLVKEMEKMHEKKKK